MRRMRFMAAAPQKEQRFGGCMIIARNHFRLFAIAWFGSKIRAENRGYLPHWRVIPIFRKRSGRIGWN